MTGHASGDGMDGVLDGDAADLEQFGEFADSVLGLGGGEAVAGDEDDTVGEGELGSGVFEVDLAHYSAGLAGCRPRDDRSPKPPKRTLVMERLPGSLTHQDGEDVVPEETVEEVPAMMRTLLPSTKPVAAAARPA